MKSIVAGVPGRRTRMGPLICLPGSSVSGWPTRFCKRSAPQCLASFPAPGAAEPGTQAAKRGMLRQAVRQNAKRADDTDFFIFSPIRRSDEGYSLVCPVRHQSGGNHTYSVVRTGGGAIIRQLPYRKHLRRLPAGLHLAQLGRSHFEGARWRRSGL